MTTRAQEFFLKLNSRIDADLLQSRAKNVRWLEQHVALLRDDSVEDYEEHLLDIAAEAIVIYCQVLVEQGREFR